MLPSHECTVFTAYSWLQGWLTVTADLAQTRSTCFLLWNDGWNKAPLPSGSLPHMRLMAWSIEFALYVHTQRSRYTKARETRTTRRTSCVRIQERQMVCRFERQSSPTRHILEGVLAKDKGITRASTGLPVQFPRSQDPRFFRNSWSLQREHLEPQGAGTPDKFASEIPRFHGQREDQA